MRKLCLLLIIALGPALIAYSYALLFQHSTAAYNSYVDEYRKWPWRAGVWHTITTLPFHGEHAPPKWVQHDIDVGGSFPIHSASSRGVVSRKELIPPDQGRAGYMVAIQEQDGLQYHVYYLHLAFPGAIPEVDDHVVQGQLIGLSGESGCPGCGAHLHFGMSTGPYSGENTSIFPLAGFDDEGDPEHEGDIHLQSYPSDNAGVGDVCGPPCDETTPIDSTYYQSFTQAFQSYGAYDAIGVTWDPSEGEYGWWWVHPWDSQINPSYTGVLQDFDSPNPVFGASAIMHGDGLDAYWVYSDFWEKYRTSCQEVQYFDYLGFPATEQFEYDYEQHHFWRQNFQGGYIFKSNYDNVVYVRDLNNEPFAASCGETDSDEDGCNDDEEVTMGFNPYNYWDVYDVPVPAVADPVPNGKRTQVVEIGDVLAVLFYGFAEEGQEPNANGVDYDSDKGLDIDGDTVADIPPDGLPDGRDYDRTPSVEPNPPDDAGPPNGVVDIGDVLATLAQAFTIDCSGGGPDDAPDSGRQGEDGGLSSVPNGMAVDAVPGGATDSARSVKGSGSFDVDVAITTAKSPHSGYQFALSYDGRVLSLLPTADVDRDGTLESWTYRRLDGATLDAEVARRDLDRDAAFDQAAGGSVLLSGATSATGVVATVRFQCVADGTSPIHLVAPGEDAFGSTTFAPGGNPIGTSLTDAVITCSID